MDAKQLPLFETGKTLSEVLEFLDSIDAINHGGCGISALAIYRWCRANGVHVKDNPFVVLCESIYEKNHNDACIASGELSEIDVPHVAIQIGKKLFDSGGSKQQSKSLKVWKYHQSHQLNESELLEVLSTPGWNLRFDREAAIPLISDTLGIDLSDVDTERW